LLERSRGRRLRLCDGHRGFARSNDARKQPFGEAGRGVFRDDCFVVLSGSKGLGLHSAANMILFTFARVGTWYSFFQFVLSVCTVGPFAKMDARIGSRPTPIGGCHMQKPLAYLPIRQHVQGSSLSMWESSILALVGAVMLFMIGFALVSPPSARVSAAGGDLLLSDEFSTGMPLP
jgi:hypothetical protein